MGSIAGRRVGGVLFALGVSASLLGADALAEPAKAVGPSVTAPRANAVAEPTFDVLVERQTKLAQRLEPATRQRLAAAGRDVLARLAQPTPPNQKPKTPAEAAREIAQGAVAQLGPIVGGDIEALMQLVMMEAARDADADLRAMLSEVKRANTSRAQLRQALANRAALADQGRTVQKPPTTTDAGATDSLTDVSDTQAMRMQMALDRLAKLEALISITARKFAETQAAIVSNMK